MMTKAEGCLRSCAQRRACRIAKQRTRPATAISLRFSERGTSSRAGFDRTKKKSASKQASAVSSHWSDERRFRFSLLGMFRRVQHILFEYKYPKMQELTNRGSPIDRVA